MSEDITMEEMQDRLDEHENRLRSLEMTREDTLKALSNMDSRHEERINIVKKDLQDRIGRMEEDAKERDNHNAERLDRIDEKQDRIQQMFAEAIKKSPPWVWPLIASLVAVGGWFIGAKG